MKGTIKKELRRVGERNNLTRRGEDEYFNSGEDRCFVLCTLNRCLNTHTNIFTTGERSWNIQNLYIVSLTLCFMYPYDVFWGSEETEKFFSRLSFL